MTPDNARYVLILQRTPFPGYWQPLNPYQLEEAEIKLQLRWRNHYDQARIIDQSRHLILYPEPIAYHIIAYWQQKMDFADYTLLLEI